MRMRCTVPYSRIMSVDVIQGPISRLSMVRGRPLFTTAAAPDISREILEELRSIRKMPGY